jgi:hypothetical protein
MATRSTTIRDGVPMSGRSVLNATASADPISYYY